MLLVIASMLVLILLLISSQHTQRRRVTSENLDPGSEVHPQYSGASPHAIPRSHGESRYLFLQRKALFTIHNEDRIATEAEIELFLGRNQQRTIRFGEDRLMITGQESLPKGINNGETIDSLCGDFLMASYCLGSSLFFST